MGLDRLRGFLRRHRRVAIDTSVFIYHLEAHERYCPFTGLLFSWLEQPGGSGVTSTITMTELLVQPYRESSENRVGEIFGLFTTFPNLEWVAPSLEIADRAAGIRAIHRLRTPDALQAATAIHAAATGFITNDSMFERVQDFETLVLDRLA